MEEVCGLKVGIVGAGGIAEVHAGAWRSLDVDLTYYSIDDRAPGLARRYGGTASSSLDALLDACEVVDVCTPTLAHHPVVMSAAHAGRHVVCEKPLARNHRDAVEMIEACERAGLKLYPGHVVRFFPEYVAAKMAVDAGLIGDPAVLRLTRKSSTPRIPWYTDIDASGGVLVDQMIHDFDFARWIAGDVNRVYAKVTGGGQMPTTAYAVLTHDNGALSHVTGSWGHPKAVFHTTFSLSGSTGMVEHDSQNTQPLTWDLADSPAEDGALLPPMDSIESPFVTELREFAMALCGGPAPRVDAFDALAALDIALAALESASSGRAVRLKVAASE